MRKMKETLTKHKDVNNKPALQYQLLKSLKYHKLQSLINGAHVEYKQTTAVRVYMYIERLPELYPSR